MTVTTPVQLYARARRERRRRAEADAWASDELERETLSAEKLRVSVMLVVVGVGLFFSAIPVGYISDNVVLAFRGNLPAFVRWRFAVICRWPEKLSAGAGRSATWKRQVKDLRGSTRT